MNDPKISGFFNETGILASHFERYEPRPAQEKMAETVFSTLNSQQHLIIEAPTGVGKSFGYLVPAIYYAKENQKKAVVSTHTINLQEQLLYKDVPLLQKILPIDFKAALLKGRSNYLCPKRLKKAMNKANMLFETDEQAFLENVYRWSLETEDGSISDLPFKVIPAVWDQICSEQGICTTKTCGGANTNCFYQKAKMKVMDADLLIVNHHLFFTLFDGVIDSKEGYLYNNDFMIFDEAHTLEGVASEHISPSLSREAIRYQLNKLFNAKKHKGFLLSFNQAAGILPDIINLYDLTTYFFRSLRDKLFTMSGGKLEKFAVRVYEKDIIENEISKEIENLTSKLKNLRGTVRDEIEENEITEYIFKFNTFKSIINNFIEQKQPDDRNNEMIYWVEISGNHENANVSINSSLIDISDYFRNNIFTPSRTSILTSATLTINGSFKYFKKRLGAEQALDMILPSQFNFGSQVKIFIPKNITPPSKESSSAYQSEVSSWITHFIQKTDGKALVLFTNYRLLQAAASIVKQSIPEHINLIVQGEDLSRRKMLDTFKEDVNSVLFGLDSFWVGVDVPGEALSNLIITKLPFLVPNHPLVQAKMEFIDSRGGNSFMEYSLPEAILKFKQGIGRLIRSKDDKGIIVILDNRIINKFYGKYFLSSIEECPIEIIGAEEEVY